MSEPNPLDTPSLLSLEFHTRFLPRLLRSRIFTEDTPGFHRSFNSNLGLTFLLFVCLLLGSFGIPMAVQQHSIIGWVLSGVGIAGFLFIFISSIIAQRGIRPSYENFQAWTFIFFLFLGFTVGLFISSANHSSHGIVLGASVSGILLGYGVGIFAGLWLQCLGWISGLLNGLAAVSIAGLIIVDMMMLYANIF